MNSYYTSMYGGGLGVVPQKIQSSVGTIWGLLILRTFTVAWSSATNIMSYLFSFVSCLPLPFFSSVAMHHSDGHGKGCHSSVCTQNCMA